MKTLTISTLLIIGTLVSANAMSQKISLDEYYSEYLAFEKTQTVISQSTNKIKAGTISLSEYYAEYCTGNDTPTQSKVVTGSTSRTDAVNTCDNHYAEYL